MQPMRRAIVSKDALVFKWVPGLTDAYTAFMNEKVGVRKTVKPQQRTEKAHQVRGAAAKLLHSIAADILPGYSCFCELTNPAVFSTFQK